MRSDEALFDALVDGDVGAFDALYARYEGPLYGFLLRLSGDAQTAEDLLHETFLAALKEGRRGRAKRSVRAWLYEVARNASLKRRRSASRETRAVTASQLDAAQDGGPAQSVEQAHAVRALRAAAAQLPLPLREVFELRAGGLQYDEVARVLALPVGTVKSRMHELLARLREALST